MVEGPAEALAKAGVSNHDAALSFETHRLSDAPQDEAGRGLAIEPTNAR